MDKFKDLLAVQLKDIYCLEKESLHLLPELKSAADNNNLKEIIEAQIVTSSSNLNKVIKASKLINVDVQNQECDFLKTVVNKAADYVNNGPLNDAGILAQIERINNYKVAIYKTAVRFSKELDYNKLSLELQNFTNFTYNIIDRFDRFNDVQSDQRAIYKL